MFNIIIEFIQKMLNTIREIFLSKWDNLFQTKCLPQNK